MANFVAVKKFAKNINLTLKEFSKEHKIDIKELDFDILKSTTYYKLGLEKEPVEISGDALEEMLSPRNLRSPNLFLSQNYDILIKPKRVDPAYYLNFSLVANAHQTKAMAVIKPDSIISPNSATEALIMNQIRAKMAQIGFLIKLFDKKLHPNVRKMLIKIKKEGGLKSEYKFIVAESIDAIAPIDEELVLHFGQDKKSYVDGVSIGDLVVEYILPKDGYKGRSLRGHIIEDVKPKFVYGEIIVDENFEEKIVSGKKFYYATKEGFIEHDKNRFSIGNSLKVDSVSFKGTGSVRTEEEQHVDLKIMNDDHTKDAIGGGVRVDVASLEVTGSIGGNAEVNATSIDVGAQTHKNAVLEATESANIKLHRGNLKTKDATIGILETGRIEAEIARIEKTIGGEIYANEVYIEELVSNTIVVASSLIEIAFVSGEGNKLYISPSEVSDHAQRIDDLKQIINKNKKEIKDYEKSHEKAILAFKESSKRITSFKKKLIEAQKNGVKPPVNVMVKLKQYKQESEKLKDAISTIEEMKLKNRKTVDEYNKELDAVFHAKITLKKGSWNGKSQIIFRDPHDNHEYIYLPKGGEKSIYLVKENDKIFVQHDV